MNPTINAARERPPPMPPDGSVKPLVPADILRALDAAIEEQGRWMTRWHRALICGLPPEADILDENSVTLTEFGHWRAAHGDDPLLSQDAFQELWGEFCAMHDDARQVALQIAGQNSRQNADQNAARISPKDYDAVVDKAEAFLTHARRIRDAFRKAVSDLDPLTGLSNRTTMMTDLAAEYERALRSKTPCCLALTDIDHFKKVNDTYGHSVGDEVLAATAGRFLSRMRPYDLIYRYGGEEFLLCLPNAEPDMAGVVLDRLRDALGSRPIPLEDGRELPVTASFGFTLITGSVPLKEAIEQADQALYRAKQTGRNRVVDFQTVAEGGGQDGTNDGGHS